MVERNVAHVRRWTLALGSSVAAMAAASTASPAAAQCAPDPTMAYGTTDCTGTDTDGLVVTTSETRITVASGATVGAGTGAAPGAITMLGSFQSLTVNGLVDGNLGGGNKAGVAFYAGPSPYVSCNPAAGYCPPSDSQLFNPMVSGGMAVGEGATVTGAQAVLIAQHPQTEFSYISVGINNAGTMTGTAGPAIVNLATNGNVSVSNEATGRIDGIAGRVDSVYNQGTIDGGTGSAIAINGSTPTNNYWLISNQGSIVSTGNGPTLSSTGGGPLWVKNGTDGVIGGGITAIYTDAALTLENEGNIRGSVVSTAGVGQTSRIDTRRGNIDGDVLLGAGDDTVQALLDLETGRVSSITGRLDGGAGIDTLDIGVGGDTTLNSNPLPANFERLGLDFTQNATVTLSPTFTVPSGITLSGAGSLINQANLSTTGQAFAGSSYASSTINVTNQANITAVLTQPWEAAVSVAQLDNSGTITAQGGGGAVVQELENTGTITASGTAATVYSAMTNAGTIVSTGGTGVELATYQGSSTNTGTITGAVTGVALSGTLTNSGSITGGVSGVTASGSYATLINEGAGTIEGGISKTGYYSSAVISNAGTINGSINLASPLANDFDSDVFIDEGGTVNGSIRLGGGDDLLIVDYSADPNRPLAGATGGVDGGSGIDTVRYRVNADADTSLTRVAGFEGLAFEVTDGAALTLRSTDTLGTTLGLTGSGTVTLEGVLSATDTTLIDASIRTTQELLAGSYNSAAQDLTIVNNGALSLTLGQYSYVRRATINASQADVVNNGSITIDNLAIANDSDPTAAIYYAKTVTNTGTIAVSGGVRAIDRVDAVINSGTITGTGQANSYYASGGIAGIGSLDNSGTIRFEGDAVVAGYSFSSGRAILTNSGTIESTNGTAVRMASGTVLTNEAGGTIRGSALAIDIGSGGAIVNRGTIVGDVGFLYSGYSPATYVADGGTVDGNVRFGSSDDIFLQAGPGSGVTGIVDGGSGINTWGYALRESASVTLTPAGGQFVNFQNTAALALGADTVATITQAEGSAPFAGDVLVGGNGTVVNTATIAGRVTTNYPYELSLALPETAEGLSSFENRGTLTGGFGGTVASFVNTGTISDDNPPFQYPNYLPNGVNIQTPGGLAFTNEGTISAPVTLVGNQLTVGNSGTITADISGAALTIGLSSALEGSAPSASLVNSGTIDGAGTGVSVEFYPLYPWPEDAASPVVPSIAITNTATGVIAGERSALTVVNTALTLDNAGTITGGASGVAVQAVGYVDIAHTIRNSGTLAGIVWLDSGDDRMENRGAITGPVKLNDGNDTFVQHAGATLGGIVDGGEGTDRFVFHADGDGALSAAQVTNFEQLIQAGSGTGTYSGTFALDTIDLQGGTLAVAAGQTLATAGAVTVTGGDAGVNVVNRGTIAGAVRFGAGNDSFTEYAGSTVTGGVDGGAGVDLYRVVLSGNRTGIGTRTNFEQLAVEGAGTLTLALDQNFQSVSLAGTSLNATLGNFTIGRIDGSATAESLTLDRYVASVVLGAGNDSLTLNAGQQASTTFNGAYDGGEGYDILTVGAPGQGTYTLGGTVIGFERLDAASSLNLAGSSNFAFDQVGISASLTVTSGASLAASRVDLAGADAALAIAGSFAGSVVGRTGHSTIEVSGTAVFSAISDVDALRMSAGLATVGGQASLGAIALNGGRLVGLAGSTITAPTIEVARGAVFGSAGTVNGNVSVAGTLSPGASPGTMTVNGNVALTDTSTSVFEITPTVSDKLVINGTLAIAQGATLQIVADQAVKPGQSLDLITASGGITGSFTNIVKPASLFGFVVQRDGTISLLGQFLNDARYSGQVRGAIDYVNAVLVSGSASSAFVAAVPSLVTASGDADQAAFARLTPEAYASARQIAVEQGLELAATGRGSAFAAPADLTGGTPHAFTFASALGATRTLESGSNGTAQARTNGYGFLGGLGMAGGDGAAQWSLGAFVGYLDSRQVLAGRGARTDVDGVVAGVHGRWTSVGGLGVKATIAYSGGNATTRRALPGAGALTATGEYDLAGWTGDIAVDYAVPLGRNWTVRPGFGLTAIRTTRDGVTETGGGAFALDVARRRDDAVFVDGALTFRGGMAEGAVVRPFLSLGARYQLDGRTPYALAALGGGGFGLQAAGAGRARLLATATVGADVALTERLTLFGALSGESGDADNRASARTGLRLAF